MQTKPQVISQKMLNTNHEINTQRQPKLEPDTKNIVKEGSKQILALKNA
jgi:hypothetical protein